MPRVLRTIYFNAPCPPNNISLSTKILPFSLINKLNKLNELLIYIRKKQLEEITQLLMFSYHTGNTGIFQHQLKK